MSKSKFVDFASVKHAVSMVQVLKHYDLMSKMQQSGDSLSGPCPIHGGENKTSFRASISKNCWNCFSRCGGGNVLEFVAKKENVSLIKAANLLVEWFTLSVDSSEKEQVRKDTRRDNPPVNKASAKKKEKVAQPEKEDESPGENKPLEFALKNLQQDHSYFAERKLSQETVQLFGLGLCQKGLLTGRIAIPIHNANGQLLAYAGRIVGNSDKEKIYFQKDSENPWNCSTCHVRYYSQQTAHL